ncbi:MAG: NUDIX domain-containing protein [Candidatus Woesearchaeota archaeon]
MLPGAKVFLKNPKLDKYLFVLRDNKPTIPNPNKWSILGGGIEEGENPTEALIREIREEIGTDIYNVDLVTKIQHTQRIQEKDYNIDIYIFKALIDAELHEINLNEGQKVSYFSIDEILEKDLVLGVRELIIKYKNRL